MVCLIMQQLTVCVRVQLLVSYVCFFFCHVSQVISLLDVFTPATSLKEFNDV